MLCWYMLPSLRNSNASWNDHRRHVLNRETRWKFENVCYSILLESDSHLDAVRGKFECEKRKIEATNTDPVFNLKIWP